MDMPNKSIGMDSAYLVNVSRHSDSTNYIAEGGSEAPGPAIDSSAFSARTDGATPGDGNNNLQEPNRKICLIFQNHA